MPSLGDTASLGVVVDLFDMIIYNPKIKLPTGSSQLDLVCPKDSSQASMLYRIQLDSVCVHDCSILLVPPLLPFGFHGPPVVFIGRVYISFFLNDVMEPNLMEVRW